MTTSFPEFVVEQGFDVTFALLAASALVYLGLTLPFVEFLNACYVGRSFLSDDVRC